ncbi:MAG: hypothetical protein L3J93_05260 [Thermoplasmata archaeon]|nr:hypothetical protein [Thermoplasmata archaeon]
MLGATRVDPIGGKVSGALLVVVLAVIVAILMSLVYVLNPSDQHVPALLEMGILSLVFALLAYFGRAFTHQPRFPQAISWGFTGLGFGLLLLTLGLAPSGTIEGLQRVGGFLVVLIALAVVLLFAVWGARGAASEASRGAERARWASQPAPNALNYAAAAPPATTATQPTAPPTGGNPP